MKTNVSTSHIFLSLIYILCLLFQTFNSYAEIKLVTNFGCPQESNWFIEKTHKSVTSYTWKKVSFEELESSCKKGAIACANIYTGAVYSILSLEEAKLHRNSQCTMTTWEHEMKHLQGYDHM